MKRGLSAHFRHIPSALTRSLSRRWKAHSIPGDKALPTKGSISGRWAGTKRPQCSSVRPLPSGVHRLKDLWRKWTLSNSSFYSRSPITHTTLWVRRTQDRTCRGPSLAMGFVLPWKSASFSHGPGSPPRQRRGALHGLERGAHGRGGKLRRAGAVRGGGHGGRAVSAGDPLHSPVRGGAGRCWRRCRWRAGRGGDGAGGASQRGGGWDPLPPRCTTPGRAPPPRRHRRRAPPRPPAPRPAPGPARRPAPCPTVPSGAAGSGRAPPARRKPRPLTRPTLRGSRPDCQAASARHWLEGPTARTPEPSYWLPSRRPAIAERGLHLPGCPTARRPAECAVLSCRGARWVLQSSAHSAQGPRREERR